MRSHSPLLHKDWKVKRVKELPEVTELVTGRAGTGTWVGLPAKLMAWQGSLCCRFLHWILQAGLSTVMSWDDVPRAPCAHGCSSAPAEQLSPTPEPWT